MMPLFIEASLEFIKRTIKWWIGLIIVLVVLAIIVFGIWAVVIGGGLWLIIPFAIVLLVFIIMVAVID